MIKSKVENEKATLQIKGDLVEHTVDEIKEEANKLIKNNIKELYLDFKEVHYISSLGIAVIIYIHRNIVKMNGKLYLINLDPKIKKLFTSLGIPSDIILK